MSTAPPVVLREPNQKRKRFTVLGIQHSYKGTTESVQGVDYVLSTSPDNAGNLVTSSRSSHYEVTAIFSGYIRPVRHDPKRILSTPSDVPTATDESDADADADDPLS